MFGWLRRTPPPAPAAPAVARLGATTTQPEALIVVNHVLLTQPQAATLRMMLAGAQFHPDDAHHHTNAEAIAALMHPSRR
jgi:hypothetical protein